MARARIPLAVTMGEPAGIGPDIILAAWRTLAGKPGSSLLVIGDPAYLAERSRRLGLSAPIRAIDDPSQAPEVFPSELPVLAQPLGCRPEAGCLEEEAAPAVVAAIDRAVDLALAGVVAGIVTGPIQKETLYRAGFEHQGHTDYLAHRARRAGHAAEPVMMLSAGNLRTVPLTVHIPLKEVPAALTQEIIVAQARVCAKALARLLKRPPRIAVTGLNPHAGEGGSMGREEIDVIAPAIAALRAEGVDVSGPFAADSIFHAEGRARFDIFLCMYHDQALIPVKTLGFHYGVNSTLGLPFVRTSPDHGTALSLAGTGRADPRSMIAAIGMARRLASAKAR